MWSAGRGVGLVHDGLASAPCPRLVEVLQVGEGLDVRCSVFVVVVVALIRRRVLVVRARRILASF